MVTLTLTYYKYLCVTGTKYYKIPHRTVLWPCWQILIGQFQIQLTLRTVGLLATLDRPPVSDLGTYILLSDTLIKSVDFEFTTFKETKTRLLFVPGHYLWRGLWRWLQTCPITIVLVHS